MEQKLFTTRESNCCTSYEQIACADPEGGGGNKGYGPHENSQNIAFSSNTGPDPLKNRNATKPALNAGPSSSLQRNIYLNNGDTSRTRVVNLGTTTKLC